MDSALIDKLGLGIAAALAGSGAEGASCRDPLSVRIASEVARPPYASGVVAVWAQVSVVDDSNVRDELYLPYFDEAQKLPGKGERCRIWIRHGDLNGFVGRTGTLLRDAKIIDKVECS
jgi:hypothetical protein